MCDCVCSRGTFISVNSISTLNCHRFHFQLRQCWLHLCLVVIIVIIIIIIILKVLYTENELFP